MSVGHSVVRLVALFVLASAPAAPRPGPRHARARRARRRAAHPERLGAAGLLAPGRASGDRRRVHGGVRGLGARASRRAAARVGDAGAGAAQGEAAARRRGGPPAGRRLGRQLLDAAARRTTCSRWTPTGRQRTAATSCPFTIQTLSDPAGHVYGMWHGTDCRVLFYRKDLVPAPPRTWDELLDTASRVARETQIAGYLYNAGRWEATVFDHLADVLGPGRRARRWRRAAGVRRAAAPPRDAARARLSARHDSARRVAAIGARRTTTTSS